MHSHSDVPEKSPDTPVPPKSVTLTVTATKGDASQEQSRTRALSLNGNTLLASWATTENVYVKNKTTSSGWATGSLQPQTAATTAILKGIISDITINQNDVLELQFPKSGDISYAGQKGTIADIAANYDYSTATASVTNINEGRVTATITGGNNNFTNQQAIVKFTLTDKADGTTKLSPTALTINDGTNDIVTLTDIPDATYTANGAGVLYVAIPAISIKTITLTAAVSSDTYTYTTSSAKTFENGKYYAISVKMTKVFNPFTSPLTLECAASDGHANVTVWYHGTLQYSTDGGTSWTDGNTENTTISLTAVGQKVCLRGTNATSTEFSENMHITCDGDCYIYGNIMSLLNSTSYVAMKAMPKNITFTELFYNPAEPHYNNIMHKEGFDLVLPVTTLTTNCYYKMFTGCTKLNHIRCLATDISAENCTYNWVEGLPDTGTFVKASSITTETWNAKSDYDGIPLGWTVTSAE